MRPLFQLVSFDRHPTHPGFNKQKNKREAMGGAQRLCNRKIQEMSFQEPADPVKSSGQCLCVRTVLSSVSTLFSAGFLDMVAKTATSKGKVSAW